MLIPMFMAVAASAATPQYKTGEGWITNDIEPAIADELIDPESARFEWPYQFTLRSNGWATCGTVNSRNRMGGYAGKAWVLVVYNEGKPVYFNVAEDNGKWDAVAGMCRSWIEDGTLKAR